MRKLFILALLTIGGLVQAQNNTTNILLRHDNKPIDFTKINEATLKDAVDVVIKSSDEKIKNLLKKYAESHEQVVESNTIIEEAEDSN